MTTLKDIRAGLAANLLAVFPDAQCSGYVLSAPSTPFFDIELDNDGIEYDQTFDRGLDLWLLVVRGVVAMTSDQGAQVTLDEWCASSGATSVKEALEADQTLGGAAQAIHVTKLNGYRKIGLPMAPTNAYLGAEWHVAIWATG